MSEKKTRQRETDRELIREKMRVIIGSPDVHARDQIAAGKLLWLLNDETEEEPTNQSEGSFAVEFDEKEYLESLQNLPPDSSESEA